MMRDPSPNKKRTDFLAHDKHLVVAGHFLGHGGVEGVTHGHLNTHTHTRTIQE